MKQIALITGLLALFMTLAGCDPNLPSESDASGVSAKALRDGFTLKQAEFEQLDADDQYMVMNKAMASIFRGMPVDVFFDVEQGLESPVVKNTNALAKLQAQLQTPMTTQQRLQAEQQIIGKDDDSTTDVDESIPPMFSDFDTDHPHLIYAARIQGYPLSRDQFTHWMAYFLANTIMFSPAREMDSTNHQDIDRTLGYLAKNLEEGTPIRNVVRGWLHNLSRWRVSRSAENHALEMFELYLGIFNDTPEEQANTINGGKACAPWYLTDNSDDYQLLKNPLIVEGAKAYPVFDQYVSTCEQLYDAVVGHPRLIPRVTEVIVNYFLDGAPAADKSQLIQDIVNTGPQTFDDIFLRIIFSKTFLLESGRPKTFEESTFNFLHAMHWTPRTNAWPADERILDIMLDSTNNNNTIAVHNMGWAAMDYKIGRTPSLPMDVLSFATYHKGIRERILLNTKAWDGDRYMTEADFTEADNPRPAPIEIKNGAFYEAGTENLKPELTNISASDLVDLVFLSALGRRATEEENRVWLEEGLRRNYLVEEEDGVIRMRKTNGDRFWEYYTDDFAAVMLDYISQLPEYYYFRAVSQG